MFTERILVILALPILGHVYGDTSCPDMWMPFQGSCYLFGHDQGMKFVEAEMSNNQICNCNGTSTLARHLFQTRSTQTHAVDVSQSVVTLSNNLIEHFCTQHGSHLVHVGDEHENNFIRDMLSRLKPSYYWMGLSDQVIEGEWRWSDTDTTPEYTDWSPGEPESAHGTANEDCAGFYPPLAFHWVDADCDAAWQPICERSGSTNQEVVG